MKPQPPQDQTVKKQTAEPFQSLLNKRITRRDIFRYSSAAVSCSLVSNIASPIAFASTSESLPQFEEISHAITQELHVPKGYQAQTLIRWGDPLFTDSPKFDPHAQTAESQLKQFGFNNDYVGFIPFSDQEKSSEHGLLVVNHEHTKEKIMHKNVYRRKDMTEEQTAVDIASLGLSVVEVKKIGERWQVQVGSKYNRRISPYTKMKMSGPAAGSERLRTVISADGVDTLGTYANCAGGITPWGTVLTAEENVHEYFTGKVKDKREARNYRRFGYKGKKKKSWSKYFKRWNLKKNPNEFNHMGWIVEIDPFDPNSTPVKRTALGRCQHEGCNLQINGDGRIVAYTGDDDKFEYIYRFVSKKKYRPEKTLEAKAHNMTLLDEGELSVAKFDEKGGLEWMPLEYGSGPLTSENDFHSQADVLIEVKRAGDLLGATPMDRPEDIEVNPKNQKVYVMLTKNDERQASQLEPCNPRVENKSGHIIELTAPNNDHAAKKFKWDILLLAGNPKETLTNYHPATSEKGWLACPDNCAFDQKGNLWVATDGGEDLDIADGLWRINTEGELRGYSRRFLSVPIGAELCGPFFTADNQSLFCAIQHPGGGSYFDNPSTRWPDFEDGMPPRPAVVVITKQDGGVIGAE